MPATITARDIRKSYGDLRAVDGVTFEVGPGEFFGILGPNGAGKTTTLEILEGLREADAGEATVLGLPPWPRNPALLPRIGVQLQASSFFERLTAREQLCTFASLYGVPARRADEMLEVVGLTDKAGTRTEKLSGGQAQRLSIACALVHDPDVLFLDEPTGALDPQARRNLWDVLRAISAEGRTVVLTTHHMDEAEILCERVAIMDHGKILQIGPPAALVRALDFPTRITVESGQVTAVDARAGLPAAEEAGAESGLLVRRGGRLGFRPALLREVAYADLADPASLHDRVAAALDHGDRPGDHAEIAHHLTLAGRPVEAAGHWAAAAAYARSVGALTEAAGFGVRATECAPGNGQFWLELEEVWAWLGRRDAMEHAWQQALALLPDQELPRAWCRRGRQLRSVVCHPEASFAAYGTAEGMLTPDAPAAVRAETLIGLAWGQAVAGDAAAVEGLLAAAGECLPEEADAETAADIAEIRILGLVRRGQFAECAAVARVAAPAAVLGRLPGRAYAVWINSACALACAGDHQAALALADSAIEATKGVPVLLVSCLAARAHLLARLGRHEEAQETAQRQRDCASRLDDPGFAATAAYDGGLVALAAGRYEEAASLLGHALAADAKVSRPAAGLARAEALARAGDAAGATTQLRAAAVEPVSRADQPWALVPRMAGIQALIAAVRGDLPLARKRYDEAATGWRRIAAPVSENTADGYLAGLVDLGRPPVVGLVEPARELTRIEHERAALATAAHQR